MHCADFKRMVNLVTHALDGLQAIRGRRPPGRRRRPTALLLSIFEQEGKGGGGVPPLHHLLPRGRRFLGWKLWWLRGERGLPAQRTSRVVCLGAPRPRAHVMISFYSNTSALSPWRGKHGGGVITTLRSESRGWAAHPGPTGPEGRSNSTVLGETVCPYLKPLPLVPSRLRRKPPTSVPSRLRRKPRTSGPSLVLLQLPGVLCCFFRTYVVSRAVEGGYLGCILFEPTSLVPRSLFTIPLICGNWHVLSVSPFG